MEKKGNDKTEMAWIILIVVVILVFGMVFSNIETIDDSSTETTKQTTSKSSNNLYEMNEKVNFGDWQIEVTDVKDTQVLKTEHDSKETKNNYIVVTMEIKNLQNKPAMLLTSDTQVTLGSVGIYSRSLFELHNNKDEYVADYNLEGYLDNDISIMFNEINPKITVKYKAVFETNKKSTDENYTLTIDGSEKAIKLY